MMRRWGHWGCIAAAAVVYLITVSTAAPVVKEEAISNAAAAASAEKPLIRTKRADEIIFNGQQETDGSRIKKSDQPSPKSDDDDDASKSTDADIDSEKKTTKADVPADDVKGAAENGGQEVNEKETEPFEGYDAAGSEKQPTEDSSDDGQRVGGRVFDEENDYGTDQQRRRRRAAASSAAAAAASKETVGGRQERSAEHPAVAMVAENMASPAVSVAGSGARLQRAKRELDADTIRELIESRQQALAPSNDERPLYDYNDYENAGGELATEQNPEEVVVEAGESAPGGVEEGPYVRGDNVDDYFTEDDRRPKRLADDEIEQAAEEEEEAEEEEAYDEAEREVVRELLAERVAEETRQALLAYLSGGPNTMDTGRGYRRSARFDQDYGDEDDEENSYEEDEDNDGEEEIDDGGESEEVDDNDERLDQGPFLPNEGPELVAKPSSSSSSSIEQKRFTYPYTYEPYGGRWGALVPGSKRSDRDPYDRLYRLAEALSRPASISPEDEDKK